MTPFRRPRQSRADQTGLHVKTRRAYWLVAIPIALLIATGLVAATLALKPAPPHLVRMTTGSEGGRYHRWGREYARVLARQGITLQLETSGGGAENLRRLADPKSGITVGFVQGGSVQGGSANEPGLRRRAQEQYGDLVALGSVAFEPIWIFYRTDAFASEPTTLRDLAGKRITVGNPQTGTRNLLRQILPVGGLTAEGWELPEEQPSQRPAGPEDRTRRSAYAFTPLEMSGRGAVEAIQRGEADVVMFSTTPDADTVRNLMGARGIRLMSLAHAEAYTRIFSWLAHVTLPRGALDPSRDIPDRDVSLLASTAALLARRDVHPAVVQLLLGAAAELHGESGPFQQFGEFPSPRHLDLPLDGDAKTYLERGPSMLHRYLPFWAATLFLRIALVLPALAIVFSVVRYAPSAYSWYVRSRIFKWYGELRYLEDELDRAGPGADLEDFVRRLDVIETSVSRLSTPVVYTDRLYTLRSHIIIVREKLERLLAMARAAS
jgi:hypothetical protein